MRIVTPPAVKPVAIEDVRAYLRIDTDDENALLDSLIETAVAYVENYTNRALITQTVDELWKWWPHKDHFHIPKTPLQTLEEAEYLAQGETTYVSFTDIVTVDTYNDRIYLNFGEVWPCYTLDAGGGIHLEWTCGYGDRPQDVPDPIRQAIKLLVGHWYENREPVFVQSGAGAEQLPFAVRALLAPYRVVSF
jgi:uncharacterized phiE125 gp8 family phage protein